MFNIGSIHSNLRGPLLPLTTDQALGHALEGRTIRHPRAHHLGDCYVHHLLADHPLHSHEQEDRRWQGVVGSGVSLPRLLAHRPRRDRKGLAADGHPLHRSAVRASGGRGLLARVGDVRAGQGAVVRVDHVAEHRCCELSCRLPRSTACSVLPSAHTHTHTY